MSAMGVNRDSHGRQLSNRPKGGALMIVPLTKHARERYKERGISEEDAVNRYARKSSNSINAVTAVDKIS